MEDTIAAISTPFGEGGIGIIRISGEKSLEIINGIFSPANKMPLKNRMMTYGHIRGEGGELIDEVLTVYMKKPKTYTAEEIVEINCHGGIVPLQRILSLVLAKGARPAEPGEFTKRAFLNGRLDLTQAEAVMDLISAKADKTFDTALNQLEGLLSDKIKECRKELMDVLVDLTVNIDYPDEDIEEVTYQNLITRLNSVHEKVHRLLESADTGRILKEGLKVTIIGKPNVGKSSLMNGLLRQSRAIVTDIPGTTRDTIEENINIKGVPILLTDTAGIRETEDTIEAIGIQRSKDSFNKSDLVIMVMDGNREIEDEDKEILKLLEPSKSIILLNKIDLESNITIEDIEAIKDDVRILPVTMKDFSYIEKIEEEILNMVYSGSISQKDSIIITNVRQKNLLEKTEKSLYDAIEISRLYEPLEIIEIDVNSAYISLGEILGEEAGDDILNEVFSRFCLGK